MPELPEIQVHAERLTRDFAGTVLERFEPLTFTALKTASPDPASAAGLALRYVGRRGKFLLLRFGETIDGDTGSGDTGGGNTASRDTASGGLANGSTARSDITFVVHLMQGGRLVPDEKLSRKPRNGLARWRFATDGETDDTDHADHADHADRGPALLLTEAGKEHKAGVWVLEGDPTAGDPGNEPAPLSRLGPDADKVNLEGFTEALASKNQRVHGFLRDQHGVAGLGRMLANEICHRAGLSPFAMTSKLTDNERSSLYAAMQACITDALDFERSLEQMSRSAERPGAVHRRKGDTCPVCGDAVRAVEYNAYEVDYCPTCQTSGKVLADNTTSKFLK